MEDRGDLEPRLRDQVTLDGVDRLRELLGRLVSDQAERANMPDAVLEQRIELALVQPIGGEQRHRKHGGQLHRLFLDRHRAQQLIRAADRGERVDVIRRCRCFLDLSLRPLTLGRAGKRNRQRNRQQRSQEPVPYRLHGLVSLPALGHADHLRTSKPWRAPTVPTPTSLSCGWG